MGACRVAPPRRNSGPALARVPTRSPARLVSRPKEFHLQPLAEPYVSLSTHTAPVAQSNRISKDMPVHEQRWTGFLHSIEPVSTAALVPRQWFVFLTGPSL